jgi:hypothetical protein
MTEYTAKIKGKGLDGTGFTEELAASLFNRVGHHMLAIVEVQVVDKHGPNLKGQRGIELVITSIEPAEDSNLEDHLRELTRTLHYNRGLDGHVGTTTEGQERTVADVMASGQQYRPHPFLPDDAAKDTPICDVCGGIEASAVHSRQDVLDEDPDDENDDERADVEAEQDLIAEEWVDTQHGDHDEYAGPHAYDAGPDDVCQCGLPFEHDVHATTHPLSAVPDPFATPATT